LHHRGFADQCAHLREHGLDPVAQACQQALDAGVIQADWILNLLARAEDQTAPEPVDVAQVLMLAEEPTADCQRYNALLSLQEVSQPSVDIIASLKALKLLGMAVSYDDILDTAIRERKTMAQFLASLCQTEAEDRRVGTGIWRCQNDRRNAR